jgi:hypothetical protein
MDPSYKVDEGYSEDTRSQDGLESPMSIEPGSYGALASQMGSGSVLLSDLMALSESERSGELRRSQVHCLHRYVHTNQNQSLLIRSYAL